MGNKYVIGTIVIILLMLTLHQSALSYTGTFGVEPRTYDNLDNLDNLNLETHTRSTIVINEIMPNPVVEDTGEFVELYNSGPGKVNVSGWYVAELPLEEVNDQISDYTGTYDWGSSGTEIPPDGYCLYVDREYSGEYNSYLNQHVDPLKVIMVTGPDTTVGNGLTNSGDNITLLDAGQTEIDNYEWSADPGDNITFGRYPSGGGYWLKYALPTPGAANGPLPEIVINEIMYDPEGTEIDGEWVELYNNGSTAINLSSWELTDSDGHYFVFPSLIFPPDHYLVAHASDGVDELDFTDAAAHLYMGMPSGIWTNTGDDVKLTDNAGTCIDYINYSNGSSIDPPPDHITWTGTSPNASEGNTLALHPNGWDTDSAECWYAESGDNITQGKSNDEVYSVKLYVDSTAQELEVGGTAIYNLTIRSYGNMDDNIDLHITTPVPPGWFAGLTQTSLFISHSTGDAVKYVKLTVTAPEDLKKGNKAVVNVTASSQNDTLKLSSVSTTTVIPGIDLIPNWLKFNEVEAPLEVAEGTGVTVKVSVKNRGELNSNECSITFYLDSIDESAVIGSKFYDSISAGGYKYPSVKWDTLDYHGNHTVYAVIDPEDSVIEYNETNNHIFGSVNVTPTAPNDTERMVLITEVYYDTFVSYEPDEYVQIHNPADIELDVSGWYLADDIYTDPRESISFPEGTVLQPHSYVYITNNAKVFCEQNGISPGFACESENGFGSNLIQMANPEDWPGLANTGDEVFIRDENRHIIDVLAYGSSGYYGKGWASGPAPDVPEGKIIVRSHDETVLQYRDTNTSDDWMGPYYPGAGQSNFGFQSYEFVGTVIPFVSPENSFEVIAQELQSAEKSILINAYEFTHLELGTVIENALERGVAVRLLLEGQPVGWNLSNVEIEEYSDFKLEPFTEKYIANHLYRKGAQIKFLVDNKARDVKKRYNFDHAKYLVIDEEITILLSGNLKPGSIPTDPSLGYGNREWGAVVHNPELAEYFRVVFEADWTPLNEYRNDTVIFNTTHATYGPPPGYFQPAPQNTTGWYEPLQKLDYQNFTGADTYTVSPVLAPDTSILGDDSVIGLIDSATASVYVNQADIDLDWVYSRSSSRHFTFNWSDEASGFINWEDGSEHHNLYLQAVIEAAVRGCDVKILVDPRYCEFNYEAYNGSRSNELDNIDTLLYINHLAWVMGIEDHLEARLAYLGGLSKIHNKGLIVDGNKVLVSSLNWNYNSVMNNREAALIIENTRVADFFERVFLSDWGRSHAVNRPAAPSTIERSLLITEVYYDTHLSYEPDEYICLHNPTTETVDLSGWVLTDQHTKYTGYEGTVLFLEGTLIGAGGVVYVTKNASAFELEMGFKPDFEFLVDSDPEVRQLEIIDSSTSSDNRGPTFANTFDEIVLADEYLFFDYTSDGFVASWRDHIIDVAVYGDSYYYNDFPDLGWSSAETISPLNEGTILKRTREEPTGQYPDTDTPADWDSPRVYRPGQSDLQYDTFTFTGDLTAFTSPDSSYEVIRSELDNAEATVYINLYQFHSYYLMEAVINASLRGVEVKVFLEGAPVGGVSDAGRYVAWKLYEHGCEVRFLISSTSEGIHARYNFDHAKYMVLDNETLVIMSENWKTTGIPLDPTFGNRGWGVAVHNPEVAGYFAEVFFSDWDPSSRDSCPFEPDHDRYGVPPDDFELSRVIYGGDYEPRFQAETFTGEFKVAPVISPDTCLLQTRSIIDMINSAVESVYIEQMQCYINWNDKRGGTWREIPNQFLEAALDAARRGCEVKIILDSAFVGIDDAKLDNYDTVEYINGIAKQEKLEDRLEAKLINLNDAKGLNYLEKVHNKGVIVDSYKTLVSSINWGTGAALYNREAGTIIEHAGVANYFETVFFYDWNLTLNEMFDVGVLYSDTHEIMPNASTEYTISITNTDANSSNINNLELSIIGLETGWRAALDDYNISLPGGVVTYVTLTVTAPSGSELNITNPGSGAANPSDYDAPEVKIGLRGYSKGMASDLIFTTAILILSDPEEPAQPPGSEQDEPGDETAGGQFSRGLDAFVVLVIVIIAVIMGAVIRDYLQHRRERSSQKKSEQAPKSGVQIPKNHESEEKIYVTDNHLEE